MFKKVLIVLCILVLLGAGSFTVVLYRMGINPALWFSMPSSSSFTQADNKNNITISLEEVMSGFSQVTDFSFFPGSDTQLLLLQKTGELFQLDLNRKEKYLIMKLDVLTDAEQGLLGVAIHPDYPKIPCIYLNFVVLKNNNDTSQVSEWCFSMEGEEQRWFQNKILLEVEQPFKNHNAGHLIFDKAGLLYIPWGDGGSREDPHGNAQNLQSYLGKILRINPEAYNNELAYSIPEDNPFVNIPDIPDEIYAYGLRNPWKLAFDPLGRLIAADVGQDKWEEITFIKAGGNHGWNDIEALHCMKPACSSKDTVMPFIEYGHDVGRSVTGGYVYLSSEIPELTNKYIYADFVSGQIWAAELPSDNLVIPINSSDQARSYTHVYQLGQWPVLISSFARDRSGKIYLADFARGTIYKISNPENNQ